MRDLETYAYSLTKSVGSFLGFWIDLEFIQGNSPNYGTLNKKYLQAGEEKYLLRAIISLNLSRLTSKELVRAAIAHELAHLVPGTEPFSMRLGLWHSIIDNIDLLKGVHDGT